MKKSQKNVLLIILILAALVAIVALTRRAFEAGRRDAEREKADRATQPARRGARA